MSHSYYFIHEDFSDADQEFTLYTGSGHSD